MNQFDKGYDPKEIKERLRGMLRKAKNQTVPADELISLAQELNLSITSSHAERSGVDESTLVNRIYDLMRTDAIIELAQATMELAKESQSTSLSAELTAKWTRRLTYATWALVIVTIITYYKSDIITLFSNI